MRVKTKNPTMVGIGVLAICSALSLSAHAEGTGMNAVCVSPIPVETNGVIVIESDPEIRGPAEETESVVEIEAGNEGYPDKKDEVILADVPTIEEEDHIPYLLGTNEPAAFDADAIYEESSFMSLVPEDDFVEYSFIHMDKEMQRVLWDECEKYGIEYAFALGTIQHESEFNPNATHHNSNGSTDRGICQVNSCWLKDLKAKGMISTADDLYDTATGLRCGMYVLAQCVEKYGNTERAYAFYNTWSTKIQSNAASRLVWSYRNEFVKLINCEE